MPVYIELFHGRKTPDEELRDWGAEGPVLGPFGWVHMTYGSDIKCGDHEPHGDAVFELLLRKDGLVEYQGVFYGDWSVFDKAVLDDSRELQLRRADYAETQTSTIQT